MDPASYLGKFKIGNANRDHALADQIYQHFGKGIPFPRIMKIIQTHGYQFAYATWNEIKQGNARNPVALFLWKVRENKINFNDHGKPAADASEGKRRPLRAREGDDPGGIQKGEG